MTVVDLKSGAKEPWHPLQLALYVAAPANPGIRFEEEGHRYYIDDRELISVTKALNPEPSRFYPPGSANRGHLVHRLAVLDAQGVLDEKTVDPSLVGYLCGWRRFKKEMVAEFLGYEEVVGDPDVGYAGRRDFSLVLKGGPLPGGILYVRKNGTYSFDPYTAVVMPGLIAQAKKRVADSRETWKRQLW